MEEKTLDKLKVGDTAIVKNIYVENFTRRRFLDIGLIPDTKVKCVSKSIPGDPSAYLIRGSVIAIRAADCKKITVY